jgi:hypothetical protein
VAQNNKSSTNNEVKNALNETVNAYLNEVNERPLWVIYGETRPA